MTQILRRVLPLTIFAACVFSGNCIAQQSSVQTTAPSDSPSVLLLINANGGSTIHPLDYYWHYEVRVDTGNARILREYGVKAGEKTLSPEKSTLIYGDPKMSNAIHGCEKNFKPQSFSSPNGKLIAYCTSTNLTGPDKLFVTDASTSAAISKWMYQSRRFLAAAWAPDSQSVAILNYSEHTGVNPLELFEAVSGHPVPHDTVYLDLLDVHTGKIREFLIRKNILYVLGNIEGWTK